MKGTSRLDNDEIRRVSAAFTGMYKVRSRGHFTSLNHENFPFQNRTDD